MPEGTPPFPFLIALPISPSHASRNDFHGTLTPFHGSGKGFSGPLTPSNVPQKGFHEPLTPVRGSWRNEGMTPRRQMLRQGALYFPA